MSDVPRDPNVITDATDLYEALVEAIVNGTAEESQDLVDALGARAAARPRVAEARPAVHGRRQGGPPDVDWS